MSRGASFKEDEGTWKGNDDGKVVNNQPQRVMDERNGIGPMGGYIGKINNDARENEMEDNMGQVNTMIGNLRNMAIDMGSELENQNRQIDRINRKVRQSLMLDVLCSCCMCRKIISDMYNFCICLYMYTLRYIIYKYLFLLCIVIQRKTKKIRKKKHDHYCIYIQLIQLLCVCTIIPIRHLLNIMLAKVFCCFAMLNFLECFPLDIA